MWAVIALSVLVALGRYSVPGHDLTGWPGAYEAFAHMWVGALILLAWNGREKYTARVMLSALTAIEIVEFTIRG